MGDDFLGWVLLLLTFGVVVLDPSIVRSAKLTLAFWVAILGYNLNSLYNAYIGYTFGADGDAASFHFYATNQNWAADPFGNSEFFIYYLAVIYSIFGISLFMGQQISVLMTALKFLVFIRALSIARDRKYTIPLLLMLALPPASISFCSITLREAYQSLFMLTSAVAAVRIRQTGNVLWLPLIFACMFGMGSSQPGLFVYSLVALPVTIIWAFGTGSWRIRIALRVVGLAVAMLVGVYAVQTAASYDSPVVQAIVSGEAAEFTEEYADSSVDSRTTYPVKLDFSSVPSLLVTGPIVVLEYMFAPAPWQVGGFLDLYAFLEGALRACLILAAFWRIWKARGEERSYVMFLMVLTLMMECLWSSGTYSWGTAIRHHVVAYPLLLLAGGPPLLTWVEHEARQLAVFVFGRRGISSPAKKAENPS